MLKVTPLGVGRNNSWGFVCTESLMFFVLRTNFNVHVVSRCRHMATAICRCWRRVGGLRPRVFTCYKTSSVVSCVVGNALCVSARQDGSDWRALAGRTPEMNVRLTQDLNSDLWM